MLLQFFEVFTVSLADERADEPLNHLVSSLLISYSSSSGSINNNSIITTAAAAADTTAT